MANPTAAPRPTAREFMLTARLSSHDRDMLNAGRVEGRFASNSDYLRHLLRADAERRTPVPKGNG